MESYEKLMNLVEDVRGIIGLHEKLHHAKKKKIAKKFAAKTPHNPFKNVKKGKPIGKTSKKVASKPRKNYRKGAWRCRCHGYDCHCVGKSPATGKEIEKHVRIDKGYKKSYNRKYKVWRAKNSKRFMGGKGSNFKSPAKKHHKAYHAD